MKPSPELVAVQNKIYTFALLTLAIKFLPITFVAQSGVRFDMENGGIVVGAFAFLTAAMTIAAIPMTLRDWVFTMVTERQADTSSPDASQFRNPRVYGNFLERYVTLIYTVSAISSWVLILLPVLLGATTSWIAWQDMALFGKTIIQAG